MIVPKTIFRHNSAWAAPAVQRRPKGGQGQRAAPPRTPHGAAPAVQGRPKGMENTATFGVALEIPSEIQSRHHHRLWPHLRSRGARRAAQGQAAAGPWRRGAVVPWCRGAAPAVQERPKGGPGPGGRWAVAPWCRGAVVPWCRSGSPGAPEGRPRARWRPSSRHHPEGKNVILVRIDHDLTRRDWRHGVPRE